MPDEAFRGCDRGCWRAFLQVACDGPRQGFKKVLGILLAALAEEGEHHEQTQFGRREGFRSAPWLAELTGESVAGRLPPVRRPGVSRAVTVEPFHGPQRRIEGTQCPARRCRLGEGQFPANPRCTEGMDACEHGLHAIEAKTFAVAAAGCAGETERRKGNDEDNGGNA
ncbi:hypothetical protein KSAC_35020 (plasmid) [Komagataeibacter saccharivorans]|nr:hypothetical protein KSAC_35020 [Komagataeibacter saccharivorans]